MKKTWAIVGGGNGGQALAGHLALMGFATRLYDIVPETVSTLNEKKQIVLSGAVQGTGTIEFATMNLAEALEGAQYIMITVPSLAHATLARQCAPLLQDGQYIFLHPGASLGALEFYKILKTEGCKAKVIVSEMNSLIYACRAEKAGQAHIFGVKQDLLVGTIPSTKTAEAVSIVQQCFPQMRAAKNIIESSLANANAILHPAPSLLNTALIESHHAWDYYTDGFSPSIGAFTENLDKERMAIAKAFDVPAESIISWFKSAYHVDATTLSEATRTNPAYQGISGQKTLFTRYIVEDIPNSLIPYIELAKLHQLPTKYMETVVSLGTLLLGADSFVPARTFENMGFKGITATELLHYVTHGE